MFNNLLHYLKLTLITGILAGMSHLAYAWPPQYQYTPPPTPPLLGTNLYKYKVGDKGPGGGWIFFVDYYNQYPGFTYLEAAPTNTGASEPTDTGVLEVWCDEFDRSIPATGDEAGNAVGKGQANTTAMLGVCTSGAAKAADLYFTATKSDWFLPSLGELMLMYTNLREAGVVGGSFASGYVWSSTEHDSYYAWSQSFSAGSRSYYGKKSALSVRAVRAF